MNKLKYYTALALVCGLGTTDVFAMPRYVINAPIKQMLYLAAKNNKPDIIQKYLNLGYSIDALDGESMSALCTAKEEGNKKAYDLLIKYGANDKHPCMEKAEELSNDNLKTKLTKYGWATAITATGTGLALYLAGGSGGEGENAEGEVSGGDSSGGNSSGSDSSGGSDNNNPGTNSGFNFNADAEFNGTICKDDVNCPKVFEEPSNAKVEYNSVNYLGAINAAEAFGKFYNIDSAGNFYTTLSGISTVGVIDSGVWGTHSEFLKSDGQSKVSGYNFDYGPCKEEDTSNCWKSISDIKCDDKECSQNIALLNTDGVEIHFSKVYCSMADGSSDCNPYEQWKAGYPVGYDWDEMKDSFYPNLYDGEETRVLHGTNVAGIIAANKDGKGNMGVAFTNTSINAVRWDLKSSIYDPLKKMLEDKVLAVNLSLGTIASDKLNATMINDKVNQLGRKEIYEEIISSYEKTTNADGQDVYDGMIIVKSAGNESYSQPDLESGFKLLNGSFTDANNIEHSYSELQMVVVAAVDVKFENNAVKDYKLSSFSNKCGVAAKYCISAPGGNYDENVDKYVFSQLYSSGQVEDEVSQYVGMMGTSQAAPVVTGSIAFLKNAFPYMKSSEILDLIFTTANDDASDYLFEIYGHGLLDLGAAVTTYISEGNGQVNTYSGNDLTSSKLNLNAANLNVTSSFKNALLNVLPKKITIFDKYNRPFAMSTQNYVTETHGDYKGFKNDVYNISRKSKVSKVSEGNFNFSFAGTSSDVMSGGMGFISAEYKQGRNVAGFYFSENTSYNVDDYFSSELNNPFMSFNSAYGIHNTFNFANGMGLKFEAVTGENGLYDGEATFNDNSFTKQSYGFNTELQIVKNGKFGLSLSSGLLYEDSALLGMNGNGAFDVADSSTYNTGITAYWYPTNKLTLSGSYYQGFTNAQSFNSSLLSTTDLVSDSFAFNANYKMDKKTNFGMLISSPLRVRNGSLKVNFPSGRDAYSDVVYRDVYKASLKPEAREYRVSAYLNKDFSDKLSLRSEMAVRFNPEHQKTGNDYRAMFGLNWTFN